MNRNKLKIVNDPNNSHHYRIGKNDTPIFMVSIDLQNIHTGQLNVVTEYVSNDLYTQMTMQKTIFNNLFDGKIELGHESGITLQNEDKFLNPNVPTVNIPSFLVRLGCEYDEGVLAACIKRIQGIARQITSTGVQDDLVMSGQNYSHALSALDKVNMVISGRVPKNTVVNSLVEPGSLTYISDLYAQTHKPLKNLIRRAYLVPRKDYEMHVFNNGVAKLQRMSDKEIHDKKVHDKKSYISWDQMTNIRSHQRALGHKNTDKKIK